MLRLYIEDTFCRYTYSLRYEVSYFYTSPFYNRWWKAWRRRCVLGKVLSGQRQTQIQSLSQVIDGSWRSGRRVWRCPWGGKFSEKPGQSGLFFRPIRNHKDMHLDSGLEWYWRGLTWVTVDHLYQLIILGLWDSRMKRLSRHSSFEALIEKNRGSSGRRRSSVRWRWNDGCCSLELPEGRFMHKARARNPFHSNSSPRHQLLRAPSLTTQSCK